MSLASHWTNLLTTLFVGTVAMSLSAYIPQVWGTLRSAVARRGTVLLTWWIWTVGAVIESMYMFFIAHDVLLVGIALVHLIACGIVAVAATLERLHLYPTLRNTP